MYGTATIAAGLTGTTVDVSTMDDSWDEDTETFLLRLSNPVNATSGTMTGIGTISDNDGIPTVSITSPTAVVEGNPTTFVVTLSAVSGLPVTVNYTSS